MSRALRAPQISGGLRTGFQARPVGFPVHARIYAIKLNILPQHLANEKDRDIHLQIPHICP